MISLKEVKSILEMETVTINDGTFECIKDSDKLISLLNGLREKGLEMNEKKEIADFIVRAVNALFYKYALLNEYANTYNIIVPLAQLVEIYEELFKTDENYQNLIVCALACMEKDREGFELTIEKLLPGIIYNSSLAFNLACMSNVHGAREEALNYVDLALKLGYTRKNFFAEPQLKSLLDNPTFSAIMNKRRLLLGEKLTMDEMLSVIKHVANERSQDIKIGDSIIHQIAEYIIDKKTKRDDCLLMLKAWLEVADRIPVSPDRKQYLAQFAFDIIAEHPELVDEMERKLLNNEMTDYGYFINIAENLASMNMTEKAYKYIDIAMRDKAEKDILQYRNNLEKLYLADNKFKSMVDAHDLRKKELKSYLLEEPNPENFEEVFTAAKIEFSSCYSYNRSERIVAITKFKEEPYRTQINEFLKTGFNNLRKQLKKKDALINDIMFDALVVAIAEWQDSSFIDLLIEEFAYVTDENESDGISRHYELNLVTGTIAVALSALGYKGSTSFFDPFLKSWEWRYKGEPFIMKVRYAKWFIEKNIDEAIAFLKDEDNKSGLGYAICALADLNAKETLPYLMELQKSLINPVTIEIIKEAIARLNVQTEEPVWQNRMIRLFGTATPSAMAMGADNDNQFVNRAREAKQNSTIGSVYEADDSAGEDR